MQKNIIDIIGDDIFITWNKVLPEKMRETLKPGESYFLDSVPEYWENLAGHTKYDKNKGKFKLTLSIQNLNRIEREFGPLVINQGYDIYLSLLDEYEKFRKMLRSLGACKNLPIEQLPQYQFKMKPLAEYQHRGVAMLANVKEMAMFADCGCVSESAIIPISSGGCLRKLTFDKIYNKFHNPKRENPLYVRSFNGTNIKLHLINNVLRQGIKDVFRVTLESGHNTETTADHEYLTGRGFVRLDALLVGEDSVMVDTLKKYQKTGVGRKVKKHNDKRIAVGPYHKFARKQLSHGGKSFSYLVEIHRATYEAHRNNMTLEDFKKATWQPNDLFYVDTSLFVIHHRDEDHYNNDPLNLEMLTKNDHMKLHTRGYDNFRHGKPEYSKVVSVNYVGKKMTYDIVCNDPHRNFVSDGMVVHNCGKTYMVINACQIHKDKNVVSGPTLVIAKLTTVRSGWMEDIKKFSNLSATVLWEKLSNKKRKDIIRQRLAENHDLYIINHDGVRLFEDELKAKNFEKVVIDESTVLKNFHNKQKAIEAFGKAVCNVSENAKWKVIMTGTPMPNTPENLWGQFFFLNRYGFFLDKKFYDFQQEYMEKIDLRPKAARYDRLGRFIPLKPRDPSRWMPRKTTKERLKSFIDSCAYRVRMKDHLKDMPPLTKIVREIEMASDQLGHYKTMKNELRVVIDDERLTVNTKLTQLMKLRQITGGFIIDQNQVTHEIPDNPKMLELDDIIETEIPEGEKFIIFAQYRYEIESLISRYKHLGVVSVYGGNTSNKNLDNIDIFLKDPTVRCIVLHPASAAHGITFTNSHYMIFYSIDASAELNYQAVKRIERNGQKHPMIVWYLLCDNSIDQHLYKTIKKKLLDQEETIDGESVNEESFAKFLLNEIRRDYLNEHITTKHGS